MKNKTELETLKDLNERNKSPKTILRSEIKAEAVKIYKAIKSGELTIDAPTLIRWFANLTEEDLQ